MSRKEILIIFLIMCCLFSLQAVAATGDENSTDSAVLTADSDVSAYSLPNLDNQLRAGSGNAGTFSDLQDDISNGKLERNYTYNSSDSGLSNGITISADLTVDGEGKVTIDAKNQARIFNIASGATVTIKGITFINGNALGNGGSISSSGVLTLIDCKFINNTAVGHGGAVYMDHSTSSTIENCEFNGNVAGLNGGAIDWLAGSENGKVIKSTFTNNTAKRSGGAIHWSGHYGTISASNFTDNKATGEVINEINGVTGGGDGGAVLWVGSHGIVKDNCNFIDNFAKYRGGAIFVHGNSTENCTNTTVTKSKFENNVAGLNGGAIDWQSGTTNGMLSYSTFTNNTAYRSGGAVYWYGTNGTVSHCDFTDNHALGTVDAHDKGIVIYPTFGGNGGAILWTGSIGKVEYTNFINNDALHNGGAVYLQSSVDNNCTNTSFTDCIFESNIAGLNGGAIDWHDGAHDGKVSRSTFTRNTAGSNGGAIFWSGHHGEILDSNFTSNTAKGLTIDTHGNIGDGGAIIWSGINGTVDNCRFIGNEAKFNDTYTFGGRGGAVYLQNCTHGNCENTTFTNVYFEGNIAGTNGGAIDWHAGAHDGLVERATFINNTARRSGGAIFWNGHNGTIRYTKFYNNRALGEVNATSVVGPVTSGGDGGAVMWSGALGDLEYCNLVNNTAAKRGGAIFLQASEEEDSDNTTFKHSYFKNNTAGTNGGAIDWNKGSHNGIVNNVTFIDNTAKRSGGAIFWFGMNGTVINSKFVNNSALGIALANNSFGNMTYGGHGGAIMWTGNNGTIQNVTFDKNTAKVHGGAMFLQGSLEYGNCENITIDDSKFTDNIAGVNGGAIDFYRGSLNGTIANCYFDNNTAARDGGAIAFERGSANGIIYNSSFVNNTAYRSGGAFFWDGDGGNVSYCNFTGNKAVGIAIDSHHVNVTSLDRVINVTELPPASIDTDDYLYVLEIYNGTQKVKYELYVSIYNDKAHHHSWLKLDETTEVSPSPTDWAIDQYFGGDGGSILWTGDNGVIAHCNFLDSDSARRGGGAYMTGGDHVYYFNCTFENCTSGTNGGGLDWLAGANYGMVIDCNFTHTEAARSAGAIYYDGDYGEFRNIIIKDTYAHGGDLEASKDGKVKYAGWDASHWDTNTTGGDGGAIMLTGNNIYIYNVTFTNCTAVGRGGVVFLQDNFNVTFELCIFENNRALGTANNTYNNDNDTSSGLNRELTGDGGAIGFDIGATLGIIKDSKFINNTAARDGGAISYAEGSSNTTMYNVSFINNTAIHDGGAIFWEGHYGIINASIFENNKAVGLGNGALISTTVNPNTNETENRYNIIGGDGGAIKWLGSHGIVINTTFYRNNASYNGGSIYLTGTETENCTNVTFVDCDFTENLARLNGGAIFWATGASNATVKSSHFINNTALRSAGAIYVNGNYLEIKDTNFINNNVRRTQTYDNRTGSSYFTSLGGNAGAICWMGSYGTVDNGTFINNTANGRGGAIQFERNRDGIVKNSWFENNSANGDGGAIDWYLGAINGQLINSTFKSNYIVGNDGNGAGIFIEGYNATIRNSRFYDHYTNSDGGAVYVAGDECMIIDSTFERNVVGDDGGAIYWEGDYGTIVNITCHDNHGISYNTSTSRGGAVSLIGSNITISKSVFTYNNVSYSEGSDMSKLDGGAMLITGYNITISDTEFSNNYALNYGGAIMIIGNETTIDNCTFDTSNATCGGAIFVDGHNSTISGAFKNTNATLSGGAIYVHGENATIVDSSFDSTYAFGSVNNGGGAIMVNGNFTSIEKSNFTNTHADNNYEARGGAIYIKGMATNITDSIFEHSRSNRYGGSIYINGTNTTIRGSNFTDCTVNSDGSQGGAIYVEGKYTSIIGSGFDHNTAKDEGGAIYINGVNTVISNSTFEENDVDGDGGGAIYVNGDYAVIEGSNFTKNEANVKDGAKGGAIYVEGENTLIEGSNFANSSAKFRGGAIYIDGLNAKVRDSNFTDSSVSGGKYGSNNPRGGAIYIKADGAVVEGSIFNCSSVPNNVGEGGAIFIEGNDAKILGSEFDSSSAYDGGAIYLLKALRCNVSDSTFSNSYASCNGGAMYSTGSNSTAYNSNFTNNLAELSGGAIYWYGGSSSADKSRYNTVDGCIFTNNIAHGNTTDKEITRGGGAIYWSEHGEYGKIKNSEFYYNSVQSTIEKKVDGGAVLWDKSYHALVDNCKFVGNFVTTDGDGGGTLASAVWAQGGAMYLRPYQNYTISNCLFENCSSSKEAGALYIQSQGDKGDVIVRDSIFRNNFVNIKGTANINGGGAVQVKQANVIKFENVQFINNSANKGGAVSIYTTNDKDKIFDNCTFENNTATGYGGAVFHTDGGINNKLHIMNSNFTYNKAERGSAIYSAKSFKLTNVELLKNTANTASLDFSFKRTASTIDLTLKGWDNLLNSMYITSGNNVTCSNVKYWTDNSTSKFTGMEAITSGIQSGVTGSTLERGISLTVELFDENNTKLNKGNDIFATDANGKLHLTQDDFAGIDSFKKVYVVARLTNEDYYTQKKVSTRLPVTMEATAYNVTYHRNATVNVTIATNPLSEGNARGIVSVYYNDTFLGNITISDNKGISDEISTFLGDRYLEVGTHNLTLRYWGDLYNDARNLTVSINVTKAQSNITIIYDDLGYDLFVNVTIVDDFDDVYYKDATGYVVIEVYSKVSATPLKTATVTLINGTALAKIENLLPSNYIIKAHYDGDHNYYASVNSTPAEVREKADAIVDIQVSAYDIMVNETVYIHITLITPEGYDATGNVTLYLDNEKYILPLNDSKAYFNKTGLTAGNKTVIVCYDGNEQLIPTSNDATFWVHKYNTTISVNTTNITHIQHEVINITLINETVGVVSVFVNDDEYFARISNGTAILELPLLPVGDYNVTVIFSGDGKYNNNMTYAKFSVLPATPDIIIDVENVTYGNSTQIVVTLINCAEGTVSIEIDGTQYDIPKPLNNGRVEFIVSDLAAGNYNVKATYSGDANHTAVSGEKKFTVYKAYRTVTVDVQDIVYGDVEGIKVYVNAAGNVTIKLNGRIIEENKVLDANNSTQVTVANLAVGVYDVEVIYNGNENYTKSKATATFKVSPMDTTLDIKVHNVVVWNDEYINVTVRNSTGGVATNLNGTLTINIDGVNHAVEIINGTAKFNLTENSVGHRVVWVFFDGNKNFTQSKEMKTYEVTQRIPSMEVISQNIIVGQDGNITVKLPANATGYVEVMVIGDGTYYSHVSNGQAVVYPKNLKEGGYSVDVRYHGDKYDNYKGVLVESYFTVSKANVNVTIDVNDTVYGNASNIIIYVDDGVEGSITIRINDTLIGTYGIVDGKVNTTVKLDAGSYTVYAEYNGNYKYSVNKTESKGFTVDKATPVITIDTPEVVDAATNATIIVRINQTVMGNITITVNGTKYNATIENGVATFTIDQLLSGQYDITAEYGGDGNYTAATPVTLQNGLTVTKVSCYQINVTANDTYVDLNTTIIVKVPADAIGNVSIYVDDVFAGNAIISQGIAQLNVTRPYGNHTINATFTDSKYGPRYAVWNYWVFKFESLVSIDVNSIMVGDKAYINVTAPSDNVTIEINGKTYNNIKYENGIAYFEVSGLEHGNKTVVAIYGGSDKYVRNATTENFTVGKRDSFIKVNATNSTVGSGAFINVTVPSDAAGYVIVTVNNTNYTINLVGGKGNVTIYNLKNNTYDVVVTYIGDEKYLLSTNSSSFNVSKVESSINITISHFGIIGNGSDADITVEVPADATGKVEITVAKQFESKTYTIYVNDGKGVLHLETPEIGFYNVTAKYLGDDKYIGSENKSKLDVYINGKELFVDTVPTTVAEKESITVWAEGSHFGDNLTITIRDNAGKVILKQNVTFTNYSADYNVSWAVLQIGPLPAGDYSVDGLYIEIDGVKEILHSGNSTFKVSKLRSTLSIKEIRNITVGEDAVIEFILDPSVTDGNVYVFVNGIEYNLTSSDLTLTIPNLRDGEYHVRAFYEGDYNYSQSNASAVFKVSKVNPQITVNATNITVGEKVLIEITAPKDVTLPVLVDVDGVGYYVNITSGKGQLYVPYLASGNYTVVVRYSGDDKYNKTQNATEFKVSKVSSTVNISVDDITVGDKAIIKVQTPKDLCGNVTVSVDGENHTVFVSGGEGTLVIADLAVGPHNVEVTFDGCKKYEPSNNTAKFNVNKVKTTEADIKVIDQGNGTVLVVVPNNATGNVTLKVGDKEFNATVVNGTAVVELDNVAPGNHEVDVIYSGDGNYNSTSTKANITAPKYDSPIDIEIGEITAGENGTIVVKLPADAAGNVTVSVDGKVYNATVVGGEAIVNVGNLTAGPKTVVVEYSGDGNYTSGYAVGNFTVEPAMIDPDISVVDYGNGTVVVVVPGDANGNVTITVDGKDYVAEVVNGTAVVELDDVTPGTHHVDVVYSGDDKYSNITKTTDITAPKYDSPIDITVAEIKSGENGTIVVKLPADAAGNVTVSVDGKVYNATVVNGEAIVNVGNLTAGPKTVVVEYSGDGNYTSAYAVGNFTVEQSKVAPDVTVVDQGNGTIVVVVPNDATGNVTVKVGDNIYNADVVNGTATITLDGLTPGENNIEVIYNGDDTYTNTTFSSVVTGPKYDAPVEIITVPGGAGEDTVITVKVPENATGNATIEIDGVKYTAEIKNGNATFRINNMTAGTKTMVVGYDGDDNYAGKYIISNVTISKVKSTVSATVTDINVGENVIITVFVPEDATGQVLIDIDGVGYYVNVTKGTGTIQIPRMPNGIYNVNLTYVGDDKYLPSNNVAVFDVNKVPSYVIPKAINIAVGENEIIVFEVPSDATGNLSVIINGKEFTFDLDGILGAPIYDAGKFSVAVSDGKGILVISGLPKGTYEVIVTYNGNYKYLKSLNTTVFNVFESSCDVDVVDLGNGTVKVYVSDNATGNVTVKVQNQTYVAEIHDGVATINLDGVSSGTHDIEVIYSGDNNHVGKTVSSTVSIPKRLTPISVSAHDIYVEDTEHIVVTVPNGATGIVTIEINSISYDAVIKNGKAVFDITGLTAGKKTVAVIYWGDDNYDQNFTTGQFEVKKHTSTAKASSKNIKFGKDETITINFPQDATGRVTVKINGIEYSGEIINGKVKIVIPNLPPGNYKAIVTYAGDEKYLPTSTTTSFNVAKAQTKMSAKDDHIDVGDDATIVVKLPKDATGKVTIVVGGKKYTTSVVNGKAIFYIPGLGKGAHTAIILYSGDGKYDARKTIATVFVHDNDGPDKNETHGDAEHGSERGDGIRLSDYPTGNPIFVLLLLILAVGTTQIRRFKR